jgi:hypothetical protein
MIIGFQIDRLCCVVGWPQILRSRVRFPALLDFLRSGGSGPGSAEPREEN